MVASLVAQKRSCPAEPEVPPSPVLAERLLQAGRLPQVVWAASFASLPVPERLVAERPVPAHCL